MIPNESHREKLRRSLQMDSMQTYFVCTAASRDPILQTLSRHSGISWQPSTYLTVNFPIIRFCICIWTMKGKLNFSEFRHIKEMPKDFDVPDFAAAIVDNFFISDYHQCTFCQITIRHTDSRFSVRYISSTRKCNQ